MVFNWPVGFLLGLGLAVLVLWHYVVQTPVGLRILASTTDERACEAILTAFSAVYGIAGVCVRHVPGVGA
jgi:hypothetical protein